MRGIRRADDLASWRAGLRNARDVGLALLAGEVGELGDVLVPFAGRRPVVGRCPRRDWAGSARRWRWVRVLAARRKTPANAARASRIAPQAAQAQRPVRMRSVSRPASKPPASSAFTATRTKADAVDAGPRRELIDERIVDLRVAELIPRHAGDARGGEFQRGPEKWRERPARVACEPVARRTSASTQAEEAEVERPAPG